MNFHIRDFIQSLKTSFTKAPSKIEAQLLESELSFNKKNYTSLSEQEFANYQNKIQTLDLPEYYEKFIQTKFYETHKKWESDPSAANYIFLLVSPIESTQETLRQAFNSISKPDLSFNFLSWETRPNNYSTLKNQLQSQIESLTDKTNKNSKSLVVIPDLSLCFLRCVEGLDSVEYLYDLVLKDHSRFWIVGCNQWAWNYFDYVYNVNTCFEPIFPLPALSAIQLQQWLTPVYGTLNLEFSHHQNDSENFLNEWQEEQEEKEEWVSKDEEKYFKHLAKISEGLSQTAAQLWLNSLKSLKPLDQLDSEIRELQKEKPEQYLILKRAKRPHLPELTADEKYLLSSIGLHEEINVSDLSVSLGEPEIQVRIQVEKLLRTGIIKRKKTLLKLSPIYYSRLKQDLIDHHILTEERNL